MCSEVASFTCTPPSLSLTPTTHACMYTGSVAGGLHGPRVPSVPLCLPSLQKQAQAEELQGPRSPSCAPLLPSMQMSKQKACEARAAPHVPPLHACVQETQMILYTCVYLAMKVRGAFQACPDL